MGSLVILASDHHYLCNKHIGELESWFGLTVPKPNIRDWDSMVCDVCAEVKCDQDCNKWFLRKNNMKIESDL